MTKSTSRQPPVRKPRTTSSKVAAKAAKILADPASTKSERSVAGSALAQSAEDAMTMDVVTQNLRTIRAAANEVIAQIDALVADSQGVYGLLKNGDLSPWPQVIGPLMPALEELRGLAQGPR